LPNALSRPVLPCAAFPVHFHACVSSLIIQESPAFYKQSKSFTCYFLWRLLLPIKLARAIAGRMHGETIAECPNDTGMEEITREWKKSPAQLQGIGFKSLLHNQYQHHYDAQK